MSKTEPADVMQRTLSLHVETSGCACTCAHCFAGGHPYPSMPLKSIERVLKGAARFCRTEGMRLGACPTHEILMHKDALKIMQLFDAYCPGGFEPLTTPGHTLGMRSDWEEILRGAKQLGTTTVWFALHGLYEVHDRAVRRKGAFANTVVAIERAKSAGLGCGANVFFSTRNVHQIPQLTEFCQARLGQIWYGIASYVPIPRLRSYEPLRPTLTQVAPYADLIAAAAGEWVGIWADLGEHTEGSYARQALTAEQAGEVVFPAPTPDRLDLVCRNNLDLHTGYQGMYGPFHGNLRSGNLQARFRKATRVGPLSIEEICFPGQKIPAVRELAGRFCDSDRQKLHPNALSAFRLWLDKAMADRRATVRRV